MKKLGLFGLAFIAIIAAALFWLRGNLDGLIKDAVEKQGSAMTGTTVSVQAVELRTSDGQGFIRDLAIGNPNGFKTSHALKVAQIETAIDIGSITKEVIIVKKIAIESPNVVYEKGETTTNIDAIQKHIADSLGPSGSKKLIVEELTIRNAKAEVSAPFMEGKTVSVTIPDITLRDIGKAKGGVSPGEVGNEIAKALKGRLASTVSFDSLAKSAGNALSKAGSAIKGIFN
jgi:hypothetical protein